MDLYPFVKLAHIIAAVAWVGGGLCFFMAIEIAQRMSGPAYATFIDIAAQLGDRFFMPAAFATLIFGIAATMMSWSFTELWIIIALAGIAITIGFGVLVARPGTERVAQLAEKEGLDSPAVRALSARMVQVARFDLTVLLLIVADMVLKPGYNDLVILSGMMAILAAAAMLFLVRKARPQVAPA